MPGFKRFYWNFKNTEEKNFRDFCDINFGPGWKVQKTCKHSNIYIRDVPIPYWYQIISQTSAKKWASDDISLYLKFPIQAEI